MVCKGLAPKTGKLLSEFTSDNKQNVDFRITIQEATCLWYTITKDPIAVESIAFSAGTGE